MFIRDGQSYETVFFTCYALSQFCIRAIELSVKVTGTTASLNTQIRPEDLMY